MVAFDNKLVQGSGRAGGIVVLNIDTSGGSVAATGLYTIHYYTIHYTYYILCPKLRKFIVENARVVGYRPTRKSFAVFA